MLLSTLSTCASNLLTPRTSSSVRSINQRRLIIQAFVATTNHLNPSSVSSPFSSFSNNQDEPSTFRPRRRLPKTFIDAPQRKHRSKKAKSPIKLTNSTPNATLESEYGHDAAAAIRHIRRTKEKKGAIHRETIFSKAEDTMRAADYLISDTGSTDDLVGERRALMDAWDLEHKEHFQKQLDEIMEEQGEFKFDYLPWKEDEKDVSETSSFDRSKINDLDNEGMDPNQKAFGPWSETIVRVDRVQKVQRGGTMVRYRALVIGGTFRICL